MSKKFEVKGNYLIITDTVNLSTLEYPTSKVRYKNIDQNIYLIYTEGNFQNVKYQFSEIVDENGSAFIDIESLLTFLQSNTGFSLAGSAALKTNDYEARVIADGGTVVNLPNVRRAIKDVIKNEPSLMMIPSGSKPTKLYSVLPVPVYGEELVVNGGFDTDTDWTIRVSWSFDNNSVRGILSGITTDFYQSNIFIPDSKIYKVSFEIIEITNGSVLAEFNGAEQSINFSTIGIKTINLDSTGGNGALTFRGSAFSGVIDNVSVKEVLVADGDFTVARNSEIIYNGKTFVANEPVIDNGILIVGATDIITVTPPVGVTEIIETIDGIEQAPITVIPVTYQIPIGNINEIIIN